MRELKYVYLVEFWRGHWDHTEYDFIGIYRRKQDALLAKQEYLQVHDGAVINEVRIKKAELK